MMSRRSRWQHRRVKGGEGGGRGVKNDEEGSRGPFHFVFWERSGEAMDSGRDVKSGNDEQRTACSGGKRTSEASQESGMESRSGRNYSSIHGSWREREELSAERRSSPSSGHQLNEGSLGSEGSGQLNDCSHGEEHRRRDGNRIKWSKHRGAEDNSWLEGWGG